jgi:hypothetical protein
MECGDASGTGLMDVHTRQFDEALCSLVHPTLFSLLPPLVDPDAPFGAPRYLPTAWVSLIVETTTRLPRAVGKLVSGTGRGSTSHPTNHHHRVFAEAGVPLARVIPQRRSSRQPPQCDTTCRNRPWWLLVAATT